MSRKGNLRAARIGFPPGLATRLRAFGSRRKALGLLFVMLPLVGPFPGPLSLFHCRQPPPASSGPVSVVVLTQNLFVGADLLSLGQLSLRRKGLSEILRQVERRVDRIVSDVDAHDFPARARGLALEVSAADPDVLLFQEVTRIEKSQCGLGGGWVREASRCALDYLEIIQASLRSHGLNYQVALVSENFDEKVPSGGHGSVRFVDRDAVLVRENLRVKRTKQKHFSDQWERKIAFRTISLRKGYQAIVLEKSGHQFLVVNLHLERLGRHKVAQNNELLRAFSAPELPAVIGGDFNADPSVDAAFFRGWQQHYSDAWGALHGARGGNTCCFRIPLVDTTHNPGSRWDAILASKHFRVQEVRTIRGRVRSSARPERMLWLSDHAGVLARLQLTVPSASTERGLE